MSAASEHQTQGFGLQENFIMINS